MNALLVKLPKPPSKTTLPLYPNEPLVPVSHRQRARPERRGAVGILRLRGRRRRRRAGPSAGRPRPGPRPPSACRASPRDGRVAEGSRGGRSGRSGKQRPGRAGVQHRRVAKRQRIRRAADARAQDAVVSPMTVGGKQGSRRPVGGAVPTEFVGRGSDCAPKGAEGRESGGQLDRLPLSRDTTRPGGHKEGLGSARLGSARLGSARLGSARLGSARLGSARLLIILFAASSYSSAFKNIACHSMIVGVAAAAPAPSTRPKVIDSHIRCIRSVTSFCWKLPCLGINRLIYSQFKLTLVSIYTDNSSIGLTEGARPAGSSPQARHEPERVG